MIPPLKPKEIGVGYQTTAGKKLLHYLQIIKLFILDESCKSKRKLKQMTQRMRNTCLCIYMTDHPG